MFDAIRGYLWRLINDPLFVIVISGQQARIKKGKLTRNFINECSEICRQNKLEHGYIYGLSTQQGIRLKFSSHIPESCHQRFRNVWAGSNDNH